MSKPPVVVDLRWTHDLVFSATSSGQSITIDGDTREGPSPTQALAIALAGCMSADVVHVLTKGRHGLRALRAQLTGERAQSDPHRFVRVTLSFTIDGNVPPDAVARAIALSRDKYCSVWHSMRQDIEFTTAFDVQA